MRRLLPSLARGLDLLPLTFAGATLTGAAVALLVWLGVGRRDLVALMFALILLTMVGVFALMTLVGAVVLRRRLPLVSGASRIDLETGVDQRTGFAVAFPSRLPFLRVGWRWSVPHLDARVKLVPRWGRLEEVVCAKRRGLLEHLPRRFRVGDFLGLTEIAFTVDYPTVVEAVPNPGSLAQLTLGVTLAAGEALPDPLGKPEGDFNDMRSYVVGDSPNRILWKIFSRSGQLMVRTPEVSVAAQPRSCLYLVSGPIDEPGAGLCRVFLEKRLLGFNWRFGADGSLGFTKDLPSALTMLARSGNPGEADHTGLAAFLTQAEQAGYEICLVVLPPSPSAKHVMAFEAVKRTRMKIRLCLAVDRIDQSDDEPNSFFFHSENKEGPSIADLTTVAAVWKDAKNEPLVIDRQRGGVVSGLLTFLGRTSWP